MATARTTSHLQRVWKNAAAIQAQEGGDAGGAVGGDTAARLRGGGEGFATSRAGIAAVGGEARQVLKSLDWPDAKIDAVAHAVEAPFSAGVAPRTIERCCRMLTGSMRSAWWASRGASMSRAGWAARCMTRPIRTHRHGRSTTRDSRSITSARNCWGFQPVSDRHRHAYGDRAPRSIAALSRRVLRRDLTVPMRLQIPTVSDAHGSMRMTVASTREHRLCPRISVGLTRPTSNLTKTQRFHCFESRRPRRRATRCFNRHRPDKAPAPAPTR